MLLITGHTVKKNAKGGQMYVTKPYQVKNNMKNISHPEKTVLDYFTVAGVSEKKNICKSSNNY